MPKFSVIIPAYNSAEFIRRALDSVKAQSFTDYELIVVCDACTDETADVAAEYGARVEITHHHNVGLARNRGLDVASGEYILFMDDDDWLLHEFVLEELSARIKDCDVLCFSFIWKGVGYAEPMNHRFFWTAVWCKCWRRTAIGDTRFHATFPEDVPFTSAVLQKDILIKYWDNPLYYYNYFREGSISQKLVDEGKEQDFRRVKTAKAD